MTTAIPLARRLALIVCVIMLASFILPLTALAGPPTPVGAENCVECHEAETAAWQNSSHAIAVNDQGKLVGATCENCHGPYTDEHADNPEDTMLALHIDSSPCQDCHEITYGQWQGSIHAEAGVQCIGCHLSHSQDLRVSSEHLCDSCHREGKFTHTTHSAAHVRCIDCHLSTTAVYNTFDVALASIKQSNSEKTIPSHDFTGALPQDCIESHGDDVHKEDLAISHKPASTSPDGETAKLAAELQNAEQSNRTLMITTPISLGLGIGIGGMMGIVAMLVIGYMCQGKVKE